MNRVTTAIIPAAGLGGRLLPATKVIPKEMLPIVDRPSIDYAVREAFSSGISKVIIVLGRNKDSIPDYFDRSYEIEDTMDKRNWNKDLKDLEESLPPWGSIAYVRQRDTFGLGHAVLAAEKFVEDDAFAVLLPDVIMEPQKGNRTCLSECIDAFQRTGKCTISLQRVPQSAISSYGIAVSTHIEDGHFNISSLVEKPSSDVGSDLAVSGRYILKRSSFDLLRNAEQGPDLEYQLTDALVRSAVDRDLLGCLFEGSTFDVGTRSGMIKASISLSLKRSDLSDDIMEYMQGIVGKLQ